MTVVVVYDSIDEAGDSVDVSVVALVDASSKRELDGDSEVITVVVAIGDVVGVVDGETTGKSLPLTPPCVIVRAVAIAATKTSSPKRIITALRRNRYALVDLPYRSGCRALDGLHEYPDCICTISSHPKEKFDVSFSVRVRPLLESEFSVLSSPVSIASLNAPSV